MTAEMMVTVSKPYWGAVKWPGCHAQAIIKINK